MTAPQVDLATIVPLKYKTWVTLVGTLLTFVGPFILQVSTSLPSGVALAVGLFFAAATTLGVYKAPYKPAGTVLAVEPAAAASGTSVPIAPGTPVAVPFDQSGDVVFRNPWK